MVYTFEKFLTDKECDDFINLIETHIASNRNATFTNVAKMFNHKYIDNVLVELIFKKCIERNIIKDLDIVGPNNLIMMAKYKPGESFGIHTDTGLFYSRETNTKTRYTLLIYLNDDFNGGQTQFYTNQFEISHIITPQKGMCLIFDIDKWHMGCEVLDGYKYWIGCELIGKII